MYVFKRVFETTPSLANHSLPAIHLSSSFNDHFAFVFLTKKLRKKHFLKKLPLLGKAGGATRPRSTYLFILQKLYSSQRFHFNPEQTPNSTQMVHTGQYIW